MHDRFLVLLSLSRFAITRTLFIQSGSTSHTFYKIRCLSVVLRICKSFAIILISPYSVYVVSEILCTVMQQATTSNELTCPFSGLRYLLERIICFPCLSDYRHQPIPALHIPCTASNITFINMICHVRCCPLLVSSQHLQNF